MPGANKSRESLALWRDERLFKRNTLVPQLHGCANADQAIAVSYRRWNVCHFVAALLSLFGRAAELLEGFEKKRFDVMRL